MDRKEISGKTTVTGPLNSTLEDSISKYKQKNRGRKRKRCTISSSSEDELILPANTLETERNLQASALKNNLDDNSVRKILKKVVTNDHVLALVQLREEEEGDSGSEDKNIQPKLTRAKVKELKKASPRLAAWNLQNLELTPINHIPVKTRPEVKALIAQELPEDEDDDEYQPTHDDVPSDDDHDHSCSDVDSQPRTPATPASHCTPSPKVLKDGPFKVPQDVSTARRKLIIDEEEATIAERTRSKLSLSTTTIEHIESSFVPPDDVQPLVDNLWSQFLSDCLDPAATHEEDDEADPEYNAAADAETLDDEEDFLGSSLIKISKKELNDLVTELFNVLPSTDADLTLETLASSVLTGTSQAEPPRWEGKTELLSEEETSIRPSQRLTFEAENSVKFSSGKCEDIPRPHVPCERVEPMNTRSSVRARENAVGKEIEKENTVIKPPPKRPTNVEISIKEQDPTPGPDSNVPPSLRAKIEPETQTVHLEILTEAVFTQEQMLILQQQLRMHVQLATSNFLQLFVHPIHWKFGPHYKGYLELLEKLSKENESSVVNVCNLKPALEIVRNWEESVSQTTPENIEMIQFITEQSERSRRRYYQNSIYVGDFHDRFFELVANSPVFLYPYLLPALPFKPDVTKRNVYLSSEDKLIVLGLDQFWKYMEDNPSIFKKPKVLNSRRRWGLATALQLVCKHMFPWMTPKHLSAHVTTMRTHADKHNAIFNYFKHNELPTVQHSILPFSPELTLYDQPEHEMPRLWVRYLGRTSKRFKDFLSRRHHVTGAIPTGVPVESVTSQSTIKVPLPHDFTKEIKTTRNPKDPLTDIDEASKNTASNTSNGTAETPIEEVPLNMYRLVNTNKGSFLVPLDIVIIGSNNTGTVTKTTQGEVLEVKSKLTVSTGTVTTPAEVTSKVVIKTSPPNVKKVKIDTKHCSCCILLRKMTKRQTVITDFFSKDTGKRKCYCSEVQYPKVTKKLRLLSNNFKNHSGLVYSELERRLEEIKNGKRIETGELGEWTLEELVSVTTFQLKILSRSLMSQFSYLKVRCKNLLTRFNPDTGDPIRLANLIFKTCQKEMYDLYLDFLEFLTIEQVDRIDKFKDYFVRNCAKGLMDKVDKQVQDKTARGRILSQIKHVFSDNTSSSCQICSYLLESMAGYDALALYTFSLFPHRIAARVSPEASKIPESAPVAHITITQPQEDSKTLDSKESNCEENDATGGESDNSSESDEGINKEATTTPPVEHKDADLTIEPPPTEIKVEPDITMDIEDSEINPKKPTENNTFIITLQEDVIKEEPIEPEWNREEDKMILQVLQQQLTPEERKDNISDMLEQKNVFGLIANNMIHRSKEDVKNRVLYILTLLVRSES